MKNSKKVMLLLAFLSLFVSMYFIQDTYAKYLTKASTDVVGIIARWNIVVNDTIIKNKDELDNLITPVFAGTPHIAPDVVAPTVTGYFDLIIDSTDVDVSYRYNISIDRNEDLPDFIVTGYSVDSGPIQSVDTSVTEPSISDNVLLTDSVRIHSIRVYIGWNDDSSTETMNNAADTSIPSNFEEIQLKVNMNFMQLAS